MTEAAQSRQAFDQRVESVRNNPDLNDAAKRRLLTEAYDEAKANHEQTIRDEQAESARALTDLERGVFSVYYPSNALSGTDKERVRQSYRDASFRVSGMEHDDLERVLERAERVGDTQLATAVYHEATERGLRTIADSFLSSRPEQKRKWDRYAQARMESDSLEKRIFGIAGSAPTKPREIGG